MLVRGGVNGEPNSTCNQTLNIPAPSDTIHVNSWDELDNLTADVLLGRASGMKLKTYNYECVDTINYSTLIFNIDAVVANADGKESHISKTAEWSVELVSVEYYPGVEVYPPHDNMLTMYYGYLERYRNYSDGSRIGPDRFLDYGHWQNFIMIFSPTYNALNWGEYESIFPENLCGRMIIGHTPTAEIPNIDERREMVLGHEYIDEFGMHVDIGYRVKVNRNAYIKSIEGNAINLESLICVDFDKDFYYEDIFTGNDETPYLDQIRDFETIYVPSKDIYQEVSDKLTVFNMCKDVPILNRQDTTREAHIIDTDFGLGFDVPFPITDANVTQTDNLKYYAWYFKSFKFNIRSFYKYPYDKEYVDRNDINRFSLQNSGCIVNENLFYSSFIHIDGRIIDFVDVCNLKNEPLIKTLTRTPEGYYYHIEENKTHYGIPIQRKCDAYFDFYDGPDELLYDSTDLEYIELIEKNKEEELYRQNESAKTRAVDTKIKKEGKPTVIIDTHLPASFQRK